MTLHDFHKHGWCAGGKPEVLDISEGESAHETPWAIDVSETVGEMVAVVGLLQLCHHIVVLVVKPQRA